MDLDARKFVLGEGVHTTKAQTTCTSAQSVQRLCYLLMYMGGGGGGGGGGQVANTKGTDHLHICAVLSAFLLFAHVHVRL